jgi:hypothetical protein
MTLTRGLHLNINLGTTQREILADNPARVYCLLLNDSTSVMYVSLGIPAVVNEGIRLNGSGGYFEINLTNPWLGRIYAVSSAADKKLMVTEY